MKNNQLSDWQGFVLFGNSVFRTTLQILHTQMREDLCTRIFSATSLSIDEALEATQLSFRRRLVK